MDKRVPSFADLYRVSRRPKFAKKKKSIKSQPFFRSQRLCPRNVACFHFLKRDFIENRQRCRRQQESTEFRGSLPSFAVVVGAEIFHCRFRWNQTKKGVRAGSIRFCFFFNTKLGSIRFFFFNSIPTDVFKWLRPERRPSCLVCSSCFSVC